MARPKKQPLLESQIRWAMKHTTTNPEAARLLHRTLFDYRQCSKMYIDENTGLTLFDVHRMFGKHKQIQQKTKQTIVTNPRKFDPPHIDTNGNIVEPALPKGMQKKFIKLEDIFENKYPKYNLERLFQKLIKMGYKTERCELCGYDRQRLLDFRTPTQLTFKEEEGNYALDNLEVVCYNCRFVEKFSTPWKHQPAEFIYDEDSGEIVPATIEFKKKIDARLKMLADADKRKKSQDNNE